MRKTIRLFGSLLILVTLAIVGCQSSDISMNDLETRAVNNSNKIRACEQRLDDVESRLDKLERRL